MNVAAGCDIFTANRNPGFSSCEQLPVSQALHAKMSTLLLFLHYSKGLFLVQEVFFVYANFRLRLASYTQNKKEYRMQCMGTLLK